MTNFSIEQTEGIEEAEDLCKNILKVISEKKLSSSIIALSMVQGGMFAELENKKPEMFSISKMVADHIRDFYQKKYAKSLKEQEGAV